LNDGIAFGNPLTMKALGSSIDSRMYWSAFLPGSIFAAAVLSSSRFGPMLPVDPAGLKVR
jgi:hypothetical protein